MLRDWKGVSTSVWIWIVGGLVIALLTFTMSFQALVSVGETSSRNEMVDQFESLRNTARLYCNKARGSLTSKKVSLSGVQAIYTADKPQNPDPEVPNYISEGKANQGKYMCLKFQDTQEPYQCLELRCETNMTYVGTPLKGTDMYILGKEDGSFQFDLTIEREETGIRIDAKHLP